VQISGEVLYENNTMTTEQPEADSYELIIQPSRGLLQIDWHGLLHYRDLLFLLVRRDFVAQYKGKGR